MVKPYNYNVEARVDGSRAMARHGDIFTNNGYRQTETEIAYRDTSTGKISFLKNPDESGSGYLTIPAEVLAPVSDAVQKYQILISQPELCTAFNMHISPYDKWVQDAIGKESVPEADGWDFDLHYIDGELEQVSIKPPGAAKPQTFELPLNWADIKEYFAGQEKPQGKLKVKVWLKEEDVDCYREKYSPGKKYGWLAAKPDVGAHWTLEAGGRSVKSGEHNFTWNLEGPKESMEQVIGKVKEWLEGFRHDIIKSGDESGEGNEGGAQQTVQAPEVPVHSNDEPKD